MPTKKRNKKTKVPFSNGLLRKVRHFSGKQLLLFGLVFAGIGAYFLFRSFAATPLLATLQTEQMTLPAGVEKYSDASASSGEAVKFSGNGKVTGTITVPEGKTVNSLALIARGNKCHGWASFSLSIDGAAISSASASSNNWTTYPVSGINLGSGSHTLSITGTNIGKSRSCYRYLYLDAVNFYGPTSSTPSVSISSPGSGSTVSGTTNITATASDNTGVAKVEFYINNSLAGTSTSLPYTYSWNTAAIGNGTYSLTAKAYNATGNVGTSGSVSVTVGNTTSVKAPTGSSPYTRMVWSDEFNGAASTQPDPAKWFMNTGTRGGGGWGNNELQTYTNRKENVVMDGQGALNIIARKETFTASDGYTRNYTSARLDTRGKYSLTYGHIEARIWTPAGKGLWPAFWVVGGNWPNEGEIDAMEQLGEDPYTTYGAIHGPKTDGSPYGVGTGKKASAPLTGGYHIYGMTWQPGYISWQLDGNQYFSVSSSTLPSGYRWVFDKPEWLTLNMAVGGNWPVPPDSTTPWPATMKVDWVRVFQ